MKRLIGLSIIFTIASITAFADVLTPEQALLRANSASSGPAKIQSADLQQYKLKYTVEAADKLPSLYVFNNPTKGYTIMGADDVAVPIVAYSIDEAFDENNIPTNLQWMLNEYSKEIAAARENANKLPTRIQQASRPSRKDVAPLLSCIWNQGAPFYNNCPIDPTTNSQSVTGCVATAMAQILYYHKQPINGSGEHSYVWQAPNNTTRTLSYNYSTANFDWNNMLDSYNGSYSHANAEAVANLMYACGVAVDMAYSAYGSGAPSSLIPESLVSHFNMDKGVTFHQRKYHELFEWEDMIYNNLTNVGPVYLAGTNYNDRVGHAFVCDGYQGDGFFHINWGWGGVSNGYFKITALDPDQQGIGGSTGGYSSDVEAVLGIKPATAGSKVKPVMYSEDFIVNESSALLGSNIQINSPVYSFSWNTLDVKLGLKIKTKADNSVIYSESNAQGELRPFTGWSNWRATIPQDLGQGEYEVRPAYQYQGEWYDVDVDINSPGYLKMRVENFTAYFETPESSSIELVSTEMPDQAFVGKSFQVTSTFVNNSDSEFLDNLYIIVYRYNNTNWVVESYDTLLTIDIPANESQSVTIEITPQNTGAYTITYGIVKDNAIHVIDSRVLDTTNVIEYTAGTVTMTNPQVVKTATVNDPILQVSADFSVTNGDYADYIGFAIFNDTGSGYFAEIQELSIFNGQTRNLTFTATLENGYAGKLYYFVFYTLDAYNNMKQLCYLIPTYMAEASSIENVETNKDIESIEYYNLSGVLISEQNLSPGIYIKRTIYKDGTIDTEKIEYK